MVKKYLQKRISREGIVTHFGDDLDNRFAVEALKRAGFEIPVIDRTPAGQPAPKRVNIDVGSPDCIKPITLKDDDTIIIDHHYSGHKNTLEILQKYLDIYVPEEAVELADSPAEQNPLEYRTGLSLARYMDNNLLWQLAEEKKLSKELTDEELEKYGLKEAAEEQKRIIDDAVRIIQQNSFPDKKAVVVNQFVKAGSQIAYALGYDIYASVQEHQNGGITFAVTAKPGTVLPDGIISWAEKLREDYGDGVFVKPDRTMVVAGGPKNPNFSVPLTFDEVREIIHQNLLPNEKIEDDTLNTAVDKQLQKIKNNTGNKLKLTFR
ncbi:hypothetical protein [Thermoanaerobacter sp. RKWS2]|uniref:hypothetical protein n=1 Tax=Thermoanaerobacter sp. RKWS2 TaxID=2983842 RepID=UPI00224A98E9|nr:hypothetical protein [Thermoanaerobacter sp. RKWS2]UZQ81837.1 hypothetical protein OEI98_001576 [Thermoanaerobacter sp. RKWS2]